MRLIDAENLYEKTAEWEAHALEHIGKLNEQEGYETPSLEWRKWTAILNERSAFKYDIMDAPTIDAVPVVRCKDCKYYHPTINTCEWWCDILTEDDYCSRAEQRDTTPDTTPSFMSDWAREIEEQLNNLKIKKENKQ